MNASLLVQPWKQYSAYNNFKEAKRFPTSETTSPALPRNLLTFEDNNTEMNASTHLFKMLQLIGLGHAYYVFLMSSLFTMIFLLFFQFKFGDIHFKKKEVCLAVSLVTGLFLSAALVNDFLAYLTFEMPEHTTQDFTFAVVVRHLCKF